MKRLVGFVAAVVGVVGLVLSVGPVAANAVPGSGGPHLGNGGNHVVFVQTDNTAGNQVVSYDRADDGTLTLANTYATGGLGGVLNGSAVDHLASQGSLAYDSADALLFAVNAASNSVSVFAVNGDQLSLRQVLSSSGAFPVSVAESNGLVYVLNAEDGGSVAGYRVAGGQLHPIEGSLRPLGLTTPTDSTQFTHTPGQVAFSPNGSQVIVTTKASTNAIDVFTVLPNGRLTNQPVVNNEPGTVPFAVTFDASGHLAVANAGTNSVATFTLGSDGTASLISTVGTGQAATCWIATAQGYLYASNAGSGTVSGSLAAPNGNLTLLGATATDPGTVDASATPDGQFLYVQTGANGIVDEFHLNANGTLTNVGSVTVAGATGGEGIIAL
jgi:6-phosphogluconolactonase (cycloisomerase 2 family)